MKTLRFVLTGVIVFFISFSVKAVNTAAPTRLTKDEVVNIYVDAVTHGDLKGLDNVLDDSLHYNINRGGVVKTMSKDELMDYLKGSPADPGVNTIVTTIASNDQNAHVRVDFKYANFTRTETLTLVNEGDWVITKIDTSFS